MEIVKDFVKKFLRQQRQTLEIVEDFECEDKNLRTTSEISHWFSFVFVFLHFCSFFHCSSFFFHFSFFPSFSCRPSSRQEPATKRRKVHVVKRTIFFCENLIFGASVDIEGDFAFMFLIFNFSLFSIFVSSTKNVSSFSLFLYFFQKSFIAGISIRV